MSIRLNFLGKRYVIEMKIWHGESYNRHGEAQIAEYLDYYHLETGYMLSFCFNKEKAVGVRKIAVGKITVYETIV